MLHSLGIENYWGFILAGILLNLTPGNDTIYILTRSISQGRNAGIFSVLGISTGALFHTILAALGLSAIINSSELIFNVIKISGALYLLYIGLKMIIEKGSKIEITDQPSVELKPRKIYIQGILTNLLNPKVALFFISFLPQFINPEISSGPVPFLILGFTFLTTGTLWCLVLAYSSSFITAGFRKNQTPVLLAQKLSGLIFIFMGMKLAFEKK